MKRFIGIAPLIVLLFAGCGGGKSESPAQASGALPEVETYVVRAENSQAAMHITASTLAVEHEADLLANEEGRLIDVTADEGSHVKKGEILARLDDSRIRKQLEQARAEVQHLEAKAREANVLHQAAETELGRQTQLRELGLGSDRDRDRAKYSLQVYAEEMEVAKFDLERAKAKVSEDELRLAWMEVRAPFDGIVSRRYARTGEMLLANAKVLRVTELRPLLVRFTTPESLRASVESGAIVQVRVSTPPFEELKARVLRTSYVVDAASGTLDCTAQLLDPVPARLVPGMSLETRIAGGPEDSTPGQRIPRSAVMRQPGGQATVLVVQSGEVKRQPIQLGVESPDSIRVLSGLKPGETIVLHPSENLRDGMKVRVRL